MNKIEEVGNYFKKALQTKWVKWVHHGTTPAESSEEKSANVIKGVSSRHCAICLNLNGCCFIKENCPDKPLHQNCHCELLTFRKLRQLPNVLLKNLRNIFLQKETVKKTCLKFGDIV